ncbi:hypothetical protein SDJN02_03548, partial [Cucurbita argyrosperma subsp. argyrosperma]
MVVATMPWLSGTIKGTTHHTLQFFFHEKSPPPTLGILSFDTAKTMAALISLYRSLSDEEIFKLRNVVVRSQGVAYLNSKDKEFLLNLACSERLEELNNAASSVSRLSKKCADLGLARFDLVFSNMKDGIFNSVKSNSGFKNVAKLIGRMEKLVFSTAELHSSMEALFEMEASEKKLQNWRTSSPNQYPPVNFEMLKRKLATQRKDVKHAKEISLWNQSFDYAVGMMTRLICVIYARISTVFSPYVPEQDCCSYHNPPTGIFRDRFWRWNFYGGHRKSGSGDGEYKFETQSGPIPKRGKKELVRFPSVIRVNDVAGFRSGELNSSKLENNRVYASAPPTTVGGTGLSLNYANVILFAERCLHSPTTIGEEARGKFYEMLPARIKQNLRAKLRRNNWMNKGGEEKMGSDSDTQSLAAGWKEAVEDMMGWLGPLAHDTMRWQSERNMEKQRFDTSPTTLLMQTLHYSDLEKTDAAIVEILVGLSCIYKFENRQTQDHRNCYQQ